MSDESEVWAYTSDMFGDVMDSAVDYYQTGWTVCGAEDPAVITLGKEFGEMHPALAGYEYVRVIDKYVNPNKSDTLLEFSNEEMTDEECERHEELMREALGGR